MYEHPISTHMTLLSQDCIYYSINFQHGLNTFWDEFIETVTQYNTRSTTDITVYLTGQGSMVSHILAAGNYWNQSKKSEHDIKYLEDIFRECFHAHLNLPESKIILARGSHWILGCGFLSLFNNGKPTMATKVLQIARRIQSNYQNVGLFTQSHHFGQNANNLCCNYFYRCIGQIGFLGLDIVENRLDTLEHYMQNVSALQGIRSRDLLLHF